MQIHISPRDVRLTAAIHTYIAQKVGHLEHYTDKIIGAHVAIWHDQTKKNKHAFVIKVHLAIPGPDLHAEDKGHDLYQAIDVVSDKLAAQLRHLKTKLTKGNRKVARRVKKSIQDKAL